jgi:pSer/pThr/pTyr-binding forkhead associated (FHA) protein
MKTQAIAINQGSTANPFSGLQMIGWLVPLQGPQRGELFTLGSQTTVGKDPSACTLVLQDSFMSSKHAEIKIEAGSWILKDLGSTNGTYVNDKRVDKQELVDNDFIKFGQFLCKFKSL